MPQELEHLDLSLSICPSALLKWERGPSNCKQNKREQWSSFHRIRGKWPFIKQKKITKELVPYPISSKLLSKNRKFCDKGGKAGAFMSYGHISSFCNN